MCMRDANSSTSLKTTPHLAVAGLTSASLAFNSVPVTHLGHSEIINKDAGCNAVTDSGKDLAWIAGIGAVRGHSDVADLQQLISVVMGEGKVQRRDAVFLSL